MKKYLILNISKKHHYAGKTVVMNTKGYIHLLIEKKEQKWRIKPAENFLMSKEKEAATVASVSNNTDENTTIEDTTSIHFIRKSSRKLTQYKSPLDDRNSYVMRSNMKKRDKCNCLV